MSRRIDQNKTPDPLPGEVIESFLKLGIPYRFAILDFAEAAIPAQTTQDSAFVEAGIVAGRLLLQFLGLGVTRKGGLTLIPSREYHTDNGFTDEVKVIDIGRRFWISLPLTRRPLTRSRTFIMVLRRHLHILLGIQGIDSISTISDSVSRLFAPLCSLTFPHIRTASDHAAETLRRPTTGRGCILRGF